ncbi:MAG: GGDEF domain-containing protein [Pseudomonadota bacterium]
MEHVDLAIPLAPLPVKGLAGEDASATATPGPAAAETAGGESAEHSLAGAYRALDHGDTQTARGLAQSVLLAAKAGADLRSEALALACLAHCDRVAQRLRRASEASRRAAEIFRRIGDNAGESAALNTFAHSTMLLGQSDEALEAALLSVQLCGVGGATASAVLAFNALGMSYCWSGMHDKAAAALDTAVLLAARCEPPMSAYQPKLNQLFVESMRLVNERYQTSAMPALTRMSQLVRECRQLERSNEELRFMPGMLPMARTISLAMKLLWAAWQRDDENARIYADRAVGSLGGAVTWLDALVHWGLAEFAWMRGDWAAAQAALDEMKSCAVSVEHEKLACLAHLLIVQVCELQGRTDMAMLEGRALRSREHRIARESIHNRELRVKAQLGARQSERHLEQALEASRRFERWSLEDALTGIANRRAFEIALADRLPGAVADFRPLTVAMIDIDAFKSVNDGHSHQVGDRVLKAIAHLLATTVRERDLAARLAGDEFVVLLNDADEATAAEIVARIQHAVAGFEWDALSPGLAVSLSIGLSQAQADDTVDTILHRSDRSMYSEKARPRWVPTRL